MLFVEQAIKHFPGEAPLRAAADYFESLQTFVYFLYQIAVKQWHPVASEFFLHFLSQKNLGFSSWFQNTVLFEMGK